MITSLVILGIVTITGFTLLLWICLMLRQRIIDLEAVVEQLKRMTR